jgi:excinuclease UvrABC nuclease subunit
VMTEQRSWVLWLVRETSDYYIMVICVLYEGKVIDVIRNKQKKEEIWSEELQLSLAREFHVDLSKQKIFPLVAGSFVLNGDLCKMKVSSRKECLALCEWFMEAYIAGSSFEVDSVMNSLLKELQDRYQLQSFPYKIECVDISHLSGWWASGGLSCLVWGVSYKPAYRRYKIDKTIAGDDYASLKFVLEKRFVSMGEHKDYPDLMIIDGWIGQLHAIQQLIREHPERDEYRELIQIVALGKWSARQRSQKSKGEREQLFVLEQGWRIREYALSYDQIDMVLTWVRDEAHRFANAYRTKQMWMEWKK